MTDVTGTVVTEARAREILDGLSARAGWSGDRAPTLAVNTAVEPRELGSVDHVTRVVRMSPELLGRTEDHVASLLGHELGHLAQGPSRTPAGWHRGAVTAAVLGALGVLAGALVAVLTVGGHWWALLLVFGGAGLALGGPLVLTAIPNRRVELAADRFAVDLLRDTPWDPTVLLRDALARSRPPLPLRPFLSLARLADTHPSHRRRLDDMHRTSPGVDGGTTSPPVRRRPR